MARIAVVTSTLHGGGAEFVARTWADWLTRRGHAVTVVAVSGLKDGSLLGAGIMTLDLASATQLLGKAVALRRFLRRERIDIAVSLQLHPNLVLLLATMFRGAGLASLRTYVSERNIVSINLQSRSLAHNGKLWLARRLYRRANGLIAISHPVGAEMVAGFHVAPERCLVVPNPATAKIAAAPKSRSGQADRDSVALVLPFRLVPQKRPWLAVEVAVALRSREIAARIVSFGVGPELEELRAETSRQNIDFEYAGWHEHWFAACPDDAVVLLPSIKEGFGNVLVEAAAAGIPSVAISGAFGVADAIVPGLSGELSLTADPESVAEAVLRARHLPMTGLEGWLERFSLEGSGYILEQALGLGS